MRQHTKLLSLLLSLVMVLGIIPVPARAATAMPFTDVKETDWFYDGVQYAYDHGLMGGTSPHRFSSDETTTRGMIVTI